MGRRLVSLTLDNVDDLPAPCRACVFWERGERRPDASGKEDWLSSVLLDWGSCGRLLYVDGQLAGFALYAPPEYAAGASRLVTSAISPDAVLLMTVKVLPQYGSAGLGRVLIQSVVKDLMRRRGVKAIEAFGDLHPEEHGCVAPVEFLTAVGFKTVHQHPRYPRLRLDLRSVLSWRGDMEAALERWLGAIRPEKGRGPVGVSPRTGPVGK